jgi:iron complex outermembrane receptor protein
MTNDSAHLLDNVPGLSFYSGGGVSSLPVIDGLADDRINILVNGMTITSACPNHMNPALSYIDPASVGSISFIAGITQVSLGGDSIGGTISIHSADAVFAKAGEGSLASGSLSAFTRSNGNISGGNANASLANEKLSIAYTGATVKSGNYKDANGNEVKSTKYKSQNHLLTLAAKLGSDVLSLDLGSQDIPFQGYPNQFMDMTSNKSTTLNALYKSTFDWGQFSARAYRHHVRHKMDMLADKANLGVLTWGIPYAMPMDTEAADTGYALQADILSSEKDVVRLDHEFHRYTLNDWWPPLAGTMMGPNTFWNINSGKRYRMALFGEWETTLNPVWTTQLGSRFERVTSDTDNVQGYYATGDMGMMGMLPDGTVYQNDANAFNAKDHKRTDNNLDLTAIARYEPNKNGSFDIGFARKTRSPNLYERFAWSNESMMAGSMVTWCYVSN